MTTAGSQAYTQEPSVEWMLGSVSPAIFELHFSFLTVQVSVQFLTVHSVYRVVVPIQKPPLWKLAITGTTASTGGAPAIQHNSYKGQSWDSTAPGACHGREECRVVCQRRNVTQKILERRSEVMHLQPISTLQICTEKPGKLICAICTRIEEEHCIAPPLVSRIIP